MDLAKKLALPVLLLIGLLYLAWWKDHRTSRPVSRGSSPSGTAAAPQKNTGSPGVPVEPRFTTEGQWLVDEITRDIAEMLLFASDAKASPAEALTVSVTGSKSPTMYQLQATGPGGSVSEALEIKHHIWSAADYASFARALLAKWNLSAPASADALPDGAALTRNLTEPTTAIIVQEERKLSTAISKAPLQPELHEQAALIIGTLALREMAGDFSDERQLLCRMSAHLALARALRPELKLCGQLAEIIQLTLVTRQAEAMDLLAKLPPGVEPWVTALKMQNNSDWRLCPQPGQATLLEQISWARASVRSVGVPRMQSFLAENMSTVTPVPDWSRLALWTAFSVEQGHIFATQSIRGEYNDLAESWKAWSGLTMQKDNVVQVLNDPATRAVVKTSKGNELAVLGWGLLAAYHQRHLCHVLARTDYFYRSLYGVPEEAEQLEQYMQKNLSALRLYPFIVRCMACNDDCTSISGASFAKAMKDAVELCQKQPMIVSASNWSILTRRTRHVSPVSVPSAHPWFRPVLPPGTAYDYDTRLNYLHLSPTEPEFWQEKLVLAPYEFDVIKGHNDHVPADKLPLDRDKESYQKISAYHLKAMKTIANHAKDDPKAYAEAMKPVCDVEPDQYIGVAILLQRAGLDAEAAEAYQSAFEKARDRVRMANHSDWIVNYYFEHNRQEDALKIAKDAAEVYSFRGLETAARLMERMSRWKEATEHYGAIAERYGDSTPLVRYLARNKASVPEVATIYDGVVKSLFPDGMKPASLADFKEAPTAGVEVMSESTLTAQWGLKRGDIIVALDEVRIESMDHYGFVRGLREGGEPLHLILWDGGQYRELLATVPNRRFECEMITYEK